MITLYGFGPYWGLPDASPFVMKAEILLKMAGLPYRLVPGSSPRQAPKHKIPYIEDEGQVIPDSTFIRFHIERKYGFSFDRGLSPQEKATAWAAEKMCEEHLYWAVVHARWLDDANFNRGPRAFFQRLPLPLRPVLARLVRNQIRRELYEQGMGRHTRAEIEMLAARDLEALAALIGEGPWLMGPTPCGADATVFAFVASALCPVFDTPIRSAAAAHANLTAYCERGFSTWFPDLLKASSPPQSKNARH